MQEPKFDLGIFSDLNLKRCDLIFECGNKSLLYWITALSEELGECAGIVKKLDRGFNPREKKKTIKRLKDLFISKNSGKSETELFDAMQMIENMTEYALQDIWSKTLLGKLGKEQADILTYLELFAQKTGQNLWENVKEKFNQVSDEMDAPEYKI